MDDKKIIKNPYESYAMIEQYILDSLAMPCKAWCTKYQRSRARYYSVKRDADRDLAKVRAELSAWRERAGQ